MADKRISEEGWPEKQCTDCGDWWPEDKEFFYTSGKGPKTLMNQCKACYLNRRRAAGTKPTPVKLREPLAVFQ